MCISFHFTENILQTFQSLSYLKSSLVTSSVATQNCNTLFTIGNWQELPSSFFLFTEDLAKGRCAAVAHSTSASKKRQR